MACDMSFKRDSKKFILYSLVLLFGASKLANAQLLVSAPDISLLYTSKAQFSIILNTPVDAPRSIHIGLNHDKVLSLSETTFAVPAHITPLSWNVTITGKHPGNAILNISLQPPQNGIYPADIHVGVEKYLSLGLVSDIIGWIYFTAWTVSFYPQLYTNYKKKSVIGLNFDFLGLNLIGFTLYSMYNLGYYSSSLIQEQFFDTNGTSANPVQLNDVVFSIHAMIVTLFTIFQCIIYERGTQRVSTGARCLMVAYLVYLSAVLGLVLFHNFLWIDFLNQCSHVKLTITLVKYIPQAYMNFQRKSTSGWSIANVLLDFTGGLFSLLQMIILAINYDDWEGFFIDTTKLGLGIFSIGFDIFFIFQHYVLYRDCSGIYDLGSTI